jgi:hypothetical protein
VERAGDRHDVAGLRQRPGEGDLTGGGAVRLGDLAHGLDGGQVGVEGLPGEAGHLPPVVAGRQVVPYSPLGR